MLRPKDLKIVSLAKQGDYLYAKVPGHPNATKDDYVFHHRFVVEQDRGRFLLRREHVHHKDERKSRNRISNLEVLSPSEHSRLHNPLKRIKILCSECRAEIERVPSQLPRKRGLRRAFCSHSCNARFYRTGTAKKVHGTESCYTNHSCRCRPCKDAHSHQARKRKRSLSRNRQRADLRNRK